MGKKSAKRGGNRFFRWIKSDLPDKEDKKSPVLLLGVSKITESPFLRRRSAEGVKNSGSIKFFRPPKSKYTRGLHGDERLERIRQDLLTHKHGTDHYIPKEKAEDRIREEGSNKTCIKLNCVGNCACKGRKSSSNRGSFSFHRPENRQSSLCPSEPYGTVEKGKDTAENEIEYKYTEHVPDVQPCTSKHSYNVTPKSADRRSLLLTNLNERFRKTLSLDSRKIDTNRAPLSLPQETRPKSLVNTDNVIVQHYEENPFLRQNFNKACQPKKKRKSFFSLETFFDKRSDSSSIDDFCSSKYKRFELESDDSPLFRRDGSTREKTPDLLNLPVIIDSVRKKHTDTKRQLEKLEHHYMNSLNNETIRTVIDAIPKDARIAKGDDGHTNHLYVDDSDVEYIEPITSNFTSQSTLILDKHVPNDLLKPDSVLTINTEETDIHLPSSTVSPKSNDVSRHDTDSIGRYEIEVKESDLLDDRIKNLTVKVMDKSVDSIGSCSLDVDASTDFSDTTSGSLNLLTPSSTTSRIKEFTSRIQERVSAHPSHPPCDTPTPALTPSRTPENPTPTPQTQNISQDNHLLKPPPKVVVNDTSSHRSRQQKKKEEGYKKPSYLNLACSVNGYTNLTTYDSKLRQDLNRSREASPIRPITHNYQYKSENNSLLVPVPVSANKLIVSSFEPHDIKPDLTKKAPTKALTDPYLATTPINVFMAEENKLLKKEFLGPSMATASRPYMSSESKTFATSMLHSDEIDNAKEITFKSSYSESNFRKTSTTNGQKTESHFSSESYTVSHTNGVSKRVEMTKENGEILTSPMKSFIQQRVERLYGPGALAQGFFNQKRHKQKSQSDIEDYRVLTEKSLNCATDRRRSNDSNKDYSSPNGEIEPNVSLPVMRHLRPEFRAQLQVQSPKKSAKAELSPPKQIPVQISKTEVPNSNSKVQVASVPSEVTNGVSVIKLEEDSSASVNGAVKANGCKEAVKDGHYFLELEKRETERLIALAVTAEKELEELQDTDVDEEVLGFLRSASGKARLLATQKMRQFEGLCYNNINETSDVQFPTTAEDLQGFWDMVCLQVDSVDKMYANIAKLKANGWKEPTPPRRPVAQRTVRVAPTTSTSRPTTDKRQAERKAMLDERRRQARERASAAAQASARDEEVVIFVGKGKSTGDAPVTDSPVNGTSHS